MHVSVFSFRRLPDTVSRQWLRKLFPGAQLSFDIEVRSELIEKRVKYPAPPRAWTLVQFELAEWIPRWPVFFRSVLSLQLRYPSVDFMPMKIEAVAQIERKRKVAATEQLVNRAGRNLQIRSQVANGHEMAGSCGSVV